ncbi:hypothetical protein [Micropruina sonneratiae]|uniref:hypothetical protein n=1 Tax=Micropruina sonneratiae TaxID=2986940 RepID=UPI0022277A2E|nr:hypothetical protein [Micropruina sp. KQZ13P-5]MCW3158150.1 hypothetical protein [Micropruina sp. KQZ13P-5]
MKPAFRNRPHAYVKLWKHHGGQEQAERMIALAKERNEPWLSRYGNTLSSEFAIPKLLETLEKDPEVHHTMDHFVDAVDWIVWQLTWNYVRSAGATGYKALFQDGQFPSTTDYFKGLDPDFENVGRGEARRAGRAAR